jgi:hypothetical protein
MKTSTTLPGNAESESLRSECCVHSFHKVRITSREIVPTSQIFQSFPSVQGRTSLSSLFAFALISGNEEGPALRDETGLISHKVAMFYYPSACMTLEIRCLSGGQPRAE